jgi:hypothetical protein
MKRLRIPDLPILPQYSVVEIKEIARRALAKGDGRGDPNNFKSYTVAIDAGQVAAKWLFWQVLTHTKAADPELPFNDATVTAHSTTAVRYLTDRGVDVEHA